MWSASDSRALYNLPAWGADYFDVSAAGDLLVDGVNVHALADALPAAGVRLPALLRFPGILRHRVDALCAAFDAACKQHDYAGAYTAVYPIKVNQQRSVVEEIAAHGGERVGLEAGSKPELLAVLALSEPGRVIVCNGYKDAEYVRLALRGQQLGSAVTLVIEKLSELPLILREATALGVTPKLGLRLRLASIGTGNWQNTGGEKSKFGLTASQVLEAIDTLRSAGQLDCLHMLHVHLGSQIANVRDIHRGMLETARVYAELRQLGVPLDCVDVGGGLGIDYDGTRSRGACSMNYSLAEYASNIVRSLAEVCTQAGVPQPDLISESGRALTAHHAVLITDVVDTDATAPPAPQAPAEEAPALLHDLWASLQALEQLAPLEVYHDCAQWLDDAHAAFVHGSLTLAQRAQAEQLARAIKLALLNRLDPEINAEREARDELAARMAGKYFLNLSVFQSLPDVWGIDQVFPIVPIQRLDEQPAQQVTVCDLTCDSDGRIDHYVQRAGVMPSLPVHALDGQPYRLAVCLVGAYQETLGDLHNLFGDTDTVNVEADGQGGWTLHDIEQGDTADELLRIVHHDPEQLLGRLTSRLGQTQLDGAEQAAISNELAAALAGYTYLQPSADHTKGQA